MNGFVKRFDSAKTVLFRINNKKTVKKVHQNMGKISSFIGKEFDSSPVYYGDNGEYIKTKKEIFENNINTNFQGKKIPKENTLCKCLSLIMLGSVIKVNKKNYSQTLLEECKYEIKKNKTDNNNRDDFHLSSSDESDCKSDRESNSECDSEPDIESKNPFKKSRNESKNPLKKSDNESKNPFKKSDRD